MNPAKPAAPPLTEEQERVVDQPVEALTLVTAGAGTGKTYTLLRRLERLAEEEDLHAGEVLVLTFSRAAVRDLRERLARQGRQARFVRAQTFDSWALDVLMRIVPDGEWETRSFDERIKEACGLIEGGRAEDLYGEDLRHVIIDEVQDLVGARRKLVQALLAEFDCGFTVVGDPAQSIYGFTLGDDRPPDGETGRFFDWLREEFGKDLVELSLTRNFRARTSEARTALEHAQTIQRLAGNDSRMERRLYQTVRDSLRETMHFGDLDELGLRSLREYPDSTAILCRTNAQALLLSERLWDGGVPHRLRRSARDRAAPTWPALLLRRLEGPVLTRKRFEELLPDLAPDGDPAVLWRLLRRVGTRSGNDRSVELHRVRRALKLGRLPDELTAEPSSALVVSTIHRAKGLEFDRVLVVDPEQLSHDRRSAPQNGKNTRNGKGNDRTVDLAEETRLLYVAMTRPRDELMWLDPPKPKGIWFKTDPRTGRWFRGGFPRWKRLGMEATGEDVHAEHPAGLRDFEDSPSVLQDHLTHEVAPGDPVTWERAASQSTEDGLAPPYLLMHRGRPIATASRAFREDLFQLLKQGDNWKQKHWPEAVTELRIDAVTSVAGDQAAGRRAGLGEHGIWLAPRIVGLGAFRWGAKGER